MLAPGQRSPSATTYTESVCVRVCLCESLSCVQLFATPWTIAFQASPSVGFSRQEILDWIAISFSNRKYKGLNITLSFFSSVQFSCSVVSDSLRPHELQHTRPPCPSQTPGVYSNSCPSSRWCHPAISSSVVPFSSCPQSLSGSFPTSQLFTWGG